MYAGMKVNWHEVLRPKKVKVADESLPLFLAVFSADKGTESVTNLTLEDFNLMYGEDADFFKYGQPIIQAHKILEAGGRILGKRIVANDATLANLIITAEIITTTTGEGDDAVTTIKVKYAATSIAGAKTFKEVETAAAALQTATVFPIFVICDNGRGKTVKNVRFAANYDSSKSLEFALYNAYDIEEIGADPVESCKFALNEDTILINNSGAKVNMALNKNSMVQFDLETYKPAVDAFVAKLATETGYTVDELYGLDILFAKTRKGETLSAWSIDPTGIDISTTYGLTLLNGTNGAFGDYPFPGTTPTAEWTAQAVAFFNGQVTDEIYDLDQYKIDFCLDANYPDPVKHAIVSLADFREDFFYLRDMNLDVTTITAVQNKVSDIDWEKTPFVGDFMSFYDVIDDYSRKQITVTMTYGIAPLLVSHYMNNVSAPMAGEFNNFVITDFVEGTINLIPRVTPRVDQKKILDDLHVNFLNISSTGQLAVQSTYTSQDHEGPLSYSSNVVVTQSCIKAIRRYVPKIRFMLMDGNDFSKYRQLINDNVIQNYLPYFKSIELIYTADPDMVAQKAFNASLNCYYKDFPQNEVFDVFAIEGSPEDYNSSEA